MFDGCEGVCLSYRGVISFFVELALNHAVFTIVVASCSLLIATLLIHIPLRVKAFIPFLHEIFKRFSAHYVLHMSIVFAVVDIVLVCILAHLIQSFLIVDPFLFTSSHFIFISSIWLSSSSNRVSELRVLISNLDLLLESRLFELQLSDSVFHELRLNTCDYKLSHLPQESSASWSTSARTCQTMGSRWACCWVRVRSVYLFSENRIRSNAESVACARSWLGCIVLFSIKFILTVRKTLHFR